MKIALIITSTVAAGALAGCYYLLGAGGRGAWTGYLVGWAEGKSGKEPSADGFGQRLVSMQKAQRKARLIHDQWHRDNPGKSCADMPAPSPSDLAK